jgi:S2P endopeptidase
VLTALQLPGITAPLSHLPTLVLAFLLAQLLHELGHALAGALEDISPSKLAFSIHLVLPSASVVFPANVDFLPVRARARIATSGPWHNLLLWVALLAVSPFGRGIFYTGRTSEGRIVTDVMSVGVCLANDNLGYC